MAGGLRIKWVGEFIWLENSWVNTYAATAPALMPEVFDLAPPPPPPPPPTAWQTFRAWARHPLQSCFERPKTPEEIEKAKWVKVQRRKYFGLRGLPILLALAIGCGSVSYRFDHVPSLPDTLVALTIILAFVVAAVSLYLLVKVSLHCSTKTQHFTTDPPPNSTLQQIPSYPHPLRSTPAHYPPPSTHHRPPHQFLSLPPTLHTFYPLLQGHVLGLHKVFGQSTGGAHTQPWVSSFEAPLMAPTAVPLPPPVLQVPAHVVPSDPPVASSPRASLLQRTPSDSCTHSNSWPTPIYMYIHK